MSEIKQEVKQFYDQVGWHLIADDVYQNARFEDLRPVSRDYIHKCHLRVSRHIKPKGCLLLDAGSGPVQYPEYLGYSRGYNFRVCADISITALQEARKRLGENGLYLVADIAELPFKPSTFDAVISLHTIHHLPEDEHIDAYSELYRVLADNSSAVVVNGWPSSPLLKFFEPLVRIAQRLRYHYYRITGNEQPNADETCHKVGQPGLPHKGKPQKGTFTSRHGVSWVADQVGALMPVEIFVWRSVSVRFLRALIHPKLGGRTWLRILFWLEEQYPHFFGENGKYPLIVITKGEEGSAT